MNGLIRQYFPKRTDVDQVTDEEIAVLRLLVEFAPFRASHSTCIAPFGRFRLFHLAPATSPAPSPNLTGIQLRTGSQSPHHLVTNAAVEWEGLNGPNAARTATQSARLPRRHSITISGPIRALGTTVDNQGT